MTDLITKKITDLSPATTMVTGDLMLVRKTGESFDRKITKENIVESLGNPAVKGFVATYEGVNQITLTAVNGSIIPAYKDKMVVSFEVPAGAYNPNANFTLRINDLAYKVVKQFSIDASITGTAGQYIEAIFDTTTNTFYQTNDSNDANSSIEYTVGGTANAIALTTINGLTKSAYYDGMTISLVTKFASNANVTIKVDNLTAKPLINQAGQPVNNLIINQPLFAIYNPTLNSFITQVSSSQAITNEYNVESTIITSNPNSTTFNLVSSVGLPKQLVFGGYYEGMTAIFTVKFDDEVRIRSTGTVFVKIDGFADAKVLTDPAGDLIPNDVLVDQTIIARYDGVKFVKNRFAVEVDDGLPDPIIAPPLAPVIDPYDPLYQGDPRDPANTLNENSVDDQGKRIFEYVYTCGTGGQFPDMIAGVFNIIREYGSNGERLNGKKIAMVLLNNAAIGNGNFLTGSDLSFITLFASNNNLISTNVIIGINAGTVTPIFNFKLRYSGFNNYLFLGQGITTTVITGKNFEISQLGGNTQSIYVFNRVNLIAKYGLNLNSTATGFFTGSGNYIILNKAILTFGTQRTDYSIFITDDSNQNNVNSVIANSIITYASPNAMQKSTIYIRNFKNLLIRNLTNITRQNNIAAIETYNSNIKLLNCTLSSQSSADIVLLGSSKLNIIRKEAATTGITNQVVGVETTLGTIIQEV